MISQPKKTILRRINPLNLLSVSLLLFGFFVTTPSAWAQPEVTVRFANPTFDCETNIYCVDVEYQSNTSGQEIFGSNVRFYYNDNVMEFLAFQDFQGGYEAVAPSPPNITESSTAFANNFGINGGATLDYVNGAIQLTNESAAPIILPTNGSWVKIFQVCFTVNPTEVSNPSSFCPSIIWDLEQNPDNGGYQQANDGVVITLVSDQQNLDSEPANEMVDQFNWAYMGTGAAPPFGSPRTNDCVNASCLVPPPPPPSPSPIGMPVMAPMHKIMLGALLVGLIVMFGFNRKLF